MENTATISNPQNQYSNLGNKVFWLFFLQMAMIPFIFFIASMLAFALSFQSFLADTLFGNLQNYAIEGAAILFLIFLIGSGIAYLIARLTYENYVFLMAEDSLKIKRGVLSKAEIAIPYRQIQNVDVERDFIFQMLGLSRLIILTAGHEDEKPETNDEAEGVIPAIDKKLAEWLQTELLKRADIQKVIQQNPIPTQNPQ